MTSKLLFLLLTVGLFTACSGHSPDQDSKLDNIGTEEPENPGESPSASSDGSINPYPPSTKTTAHSTTTPLNFLIVGDQGTAGTTALGAASGSGVQGELAEVMKRVCDAKVDGDISGCHFGIAAGDNFYDAGVTSNNDDRFRQTYEEIYGQRLAIPFYLVLGNHDNGLSGDTINLGDYQVEYTHLEEDFPAQYASVEDTYTGTFNMPGRYYSHRWGDVLELFAVDGDTIDTDIGNASALGINYDSSFQRAWLKKAAEISPAKWKMSFSHYNYISNGNYGNGSGSFKQAMQEALCDKVQFHIQGHEHDLRWMSPEESCGRTEFVISGAGGRTETRPASNLGYPERAGDTGKSDYRDSAGFMWASIVGDTIFVEWYGETDDAVPVPLETFEVTLQELGWE